MSLSGSFKDYTLSNAFRRYHSWRQRKEDWRAVSVVSKLTVKTYSNCMGRIVPESDNHQPSDVIVRKRYGK
jgi:hypothetical protein